MPTTTIEISGNRKLDARPDRLDLHDSPYVTPVITLPPPYPTRDADVEKPLPDYVAENLTLDQQAEGSCTVFGIASVTHYFLCRQEMLQGEPKSIERVSTRVLYNVADNPHCPSLTAGAFCGW